MTSYPTILGNGGEWGGYPFNPGSYSSNVYSAVGLGQSAMVIPQVWNTSPGFATETSARQKIRAAGTVADLTWGLTQAFGTALTLTLRQNSVNTNLSVSFGSSYTGWMTDTSHNVSVSSGDWIDFLTDVGSGNTNYTGTFYCASASFTATTGSAQLFATTGPHALNYIASSADRYADFLGILVFDLSENKAQFSALTSGTWEHLACHVDANTLDASTTIRSRLASSPSIAPSDGNMTIVVPSSVLSGTGNFEDVTHSDSVVAGYLLDYKFSTAPTMGSATFDWVGSHYVGATSSNCMIGGMPGASTTIPYNELGYTSLFGGGDIAPLSLNGNIEHATGAFPYNATLQDYSNYITAGEGTCTLMINGAASTLAVTASTGHTGWLTDISHTTTVSAGDTCANRISGSGVSGTSITYQGAGLLVVA